MSATVSARESESILLDILRDELALCAAARADTGVPVRMDRVRVGVPLVVAFAVLDEVADDVGVEDLGVFEAAGAWTLSAEAARPDTEGFGLLVAADMVGLETVYPKLHIPNG